MPCTVSGKLMQQICNCRVPGKPAIQLSFANVAEAVAMVAARHGFMNSRSVYMPLLPLDKQPLAGRVRELRRQQRRPDADMPQANGSAVAGAGGSAAAGAGGHNPGNQARRDRKRPLPEADDEFVYDI